MRRDPSAGTPEPHGIKGTPFHAAKRVAGDYSLDVRSPGFDAGEVLPSFNDDFIGKGPDIGAFEAGALPMEFGVKAHLK